MASIPESHFLHPIFIIPDGIQRGKLTGICGARRTGTTNFCFELCVRVQLPKCCGGWEGKVIFINSGPPLQLQLLTRHIIPRFVTHVQSLCTHETKMDKISMLRSMKFYNVDDQKDLDNTLITIAKILRDNPQIRLVIFDSISTFFENYSMLKTADHSLSYLNPSLRESSLTDLEENEKKKSKFLKMEGLIQNIVTQFQRLARRHNIAVVLVTKTYKTQYDSKNLIEPMINPFLRDTYLQKMNIRMTMSVDPRNESRTVVRVLKCSKYLFYKAQFKNTPFMIEPIKKKKKENKATASLIANLPLITH